MRIFAYEILEDIDKATDNKKIELLKKYGNTSPFNYILSLNFNENMDLGVPSGMPGLKVYKRDEATHPDLFPSILQTEIRRIVSLYKNKDKIPKAKREHIFLQVIETIPPKEADILIFAKDHALHELYPTITYELVESIFPQFCKKKVES